MSPCRLLMDVIILLEIKNIWNDVDFLLLIVHVIIKEVLRSDLIGYIEDVILLKRYQEQRNNNK